MTLVAYYVSDHGYGHASRSIAVIRALLAEDPEVEVVVKSARPFSFLESSLGNPRVSFSRRTNDVGLILKPEGFQVDTEATRHAATHWVESWPHWLEEEGCFWEGGPGRASPSGCMNAVVKWRRRFSKREGPIWGFGRTGE